jgi:3-ketosteroid 9alpha-monooxygenase subunit B
MDEMASGAGLPFAPPGVAPEREPARRKRIHEMEVMVADAVVETPDTTTLVLVGGGDGFDYRSGQFLTIDPHQFQELAQFIAYFEEVKGKRELPRAYSMASAPHERHLAFTVKEERYVRGQTRYPPLLSPLLVRRGARGTRLAIVGFTGAYVLPDDVESRTDHLVHLVAGSGSVPNFSILKDALVRFPRVRHTFVYSNKTWEDVIFREELAALEARFPSRLRVVHTLTRDPTHPAGPCIRTGRVSAALLRELVPDPGSCLIYACGPAVSPWDRAAARERGEQPKPRFMETVVAALDEIGVPRGRVKRESYG